MIERLFLRKESLFCIPSYKVFIYVIYCILLIVNRNKFRIFVIGIAELLD